ncbi:CLUMA_CG020288, isoform A [Clunio marinus]|uniref:ribonuclease III n=1 Tax=Clunio marinus TaxID=568069 RepID=A0A1J1J4H3_9DIPT|nr:CLUMA_CG020288, isoform A [Clunio marinus]
MTPPNFYEGNISAISFTPRDYQVELLSAAKERNIIICLTQNSAKEFCALKLIQELSHELRNKPNKKISLFLTSSPSAYNLIYYLTDLKVINLNDLNEDLIDWDNLTDYQVVILETQQCLDALKCSYLDLSCVNLIIVDDCHRRTRKSDITEIFLKYYKHCIEKPKIFGLAGPIHNAQCEPGRLGAELEHLESLMMAKAETASDIVTVLRYSLKPIEILAECSAPKDNDLASYIRNLMLTRKAYILDHRYDPSEIYGGEEFKDELANIPDPKDEPIKCIDEFLFILNELGVYCADKAALMLLMHIEKQKVKTPYERHFLLLCLVSTTLIQVRSFCDLAFQEMKTEKERIETYITPKVSRILEILKLFKPEKSNHHREKVKKENHLENDEKCHSSACKELLKDLSTESISKMMTTASERIEKIGEDLENLKVSLNKITKETTPSLNSAPYQKNYRYNRFKNRRRFFHRPRHHNNQNEAESLCGLIFCELVITTKTLFCLFCEVSRHDPDLKFLNVQYTINKTADPITESKEAEAEHRKQEEVLKKFRMHECNLLISTAVLEEGFDLPKCNLVVRWDSPKSYRSYVQCKGRAKAPNALHVIMIAPGMNDDLHQSIMSEEIGKKNHKMICDMIRYENDDGSDDEDDESYEMKSISSETSDASIKKCIVESNEGEIEEITAVDYYESVEACSERMIERLAEYMEIEKMLIRKCENKEPPMYELSHADKYATLIQPYQPIRSSDAPQVNLSTAISLINKYCAKLPSDTFTKLTPIWRCCKSERNGVQMFQYTLRLPLNSPMKHDIVGIPMPTRTLARRLAALIACRILHKSGELDDNLQPIGKEGFKAIETDWEMFELDKCDEEISGDNNSSEPRPGTTKRRQYYYKRIASVFSNCRPTTSTKAYLYHITMVLQCPIPEEQNTRGRKIYPPEDALQSFGILTTKKIPKISAFPIFTRSGEVKVSLQLIRESVTLDVDQLDKINNFINYTFTNVLRLRKYLMLFDPEAYENSFFVIPVTRKKTADNDLDIDWKFLKLIQENVNMTPQFVSDDERSNQTFDHNKFRDAVVMPWYRNQDQPQYFYVAEICYHLTPESSFPGENYSTFREYYFKKYNIEIQNKKQPLLDVDHTSARLNFLTPRYVNRKGVALPTSSEETKRAKRENLEQKQILVPELCTVHPFPASLWRAAVCLPCVLYRINALLLADEIRMEVSVDLGLGTLEVKNEKFIWPMLDFGWTLADVLKKTREAKLCQTDSEELDEKREESEKDVEEAKKTANDLLEEGDQKARKGHLLEIGTWSNEMAKSFDNDEDDDENLDILPRNLELCTSRNIRYGSPTSWNIKTQNGVTKTKQMENVYQSDSDEFLSDDDDFESSKEEDENEDDLDEYGLKIEFKNDHLAEAVETEEEIKRRQRKLDFINETIAIEKHYELVKNQTSGFDFIDESNLSELEEKIEMHELMFEKSTTELKAMIKSSGVLIKQTEIIPTKIRQALKNEIDLSSSFDVEVFDLIPYLDRNEVMTVMEQEQLTIDDLYELNLMYEERHPDEEFQVIGCGDLFDRFSDGNKLVITENKEKVIKLAIRNNLEKLIKLKEDDDDKLKRIMNPIPLDPSPDPSAFSFDYQPDLCGHPGPSPSIILQALTMSNANDGINLERLETIGDSFLKYAITTYLYCTYENVNEGKLSYLRSKQVSNLNLYRLGRRKILGESMIATKFEPHDNWLPPCYFVPKELEQALIDAKIPVCYWNLADLPDIKKLSSDEICELVRERAEKLGKLEDNLEINGDEFQVKMQNENIQTPVPLPMNDDEPTTVTENYPCFIPYNLVTQHSIPDKSIADCVEALIGAYLIDCGGRGALLFMAWLGIRVLPIINVPVQVKRIPGSTKPFEEDGIMKQTLYGHWIPPKSPLLHCIPDAENVLELLLDGFDVFEEELNYKFKDRSYLLQAMTHASYSPNRLTDCYQRLEFLGDAVLDYLITRHLYEDPRQHSPGALTDLRSALVNNTIFASLAVRHGFHKYFRHLSPALNEVIDRFVRIQHENGHNISEEYYLMSEDECDEAEDVEVPKALGDVFESVAGAIFLDSNMSLDAVWRVYFKMMGPEIEQFSCSVPKSPIRELLELEPETAKFGKPEKLADGRRVRVTVEVFGKGIFRGIGRNYRIAKCTAAKCALRQLKKNNMINKRH